MKREVELVVYRDQVGPDSREELSESRRLCGKVTERAVAHNPVRVDAEDVVPARIQIGRLHQADGEVIPEVSPDRPVPDPFRSAAAAFYRTPVVDVPGQVEQWNRVEKRKQQGNHQHHADRAQEEKRQRPLENSERLEPPLQRDTERSKLYS